MDPRNRLIGNLKSQVAELIAQLAARDQHIRLGMSWARISDLLKEAFGLRVTPSGLYQSGLRFLHEGVEETNDQAERQLRPAVIRRKTGGCNRSRNSARAHAILASIAATYKQQAMSSLKFLESCQKAQGELPSLLRGEEAPAPG